MRIALTRARLPRTNIAKARQSSSWRDVRLWLGLVLVLASVISANWYVNRIGHRSFAVVTQHDLAQGSVIEEADIALVPVAVPQGVKVITDATQVLGSIAARDVAAGELISANAVGGSVPDASRVVSVAIRAGRLPSLQHGQRVDVWMTPSSDGAQMPGPSELVVPGAVVVSAPESVDALTESAVSLALADDQVGALLAAMRDGVVDVVAIGQVPR
jgi:hypothetical protein